MSQESSQSFSTAVVCDLQEPCAAFETFETRQIIFQLYADVDISQSRSYVQLADRSDDIEFLSESLQHFPLAFPSRRCNLSATYARIPCSQLPCRANASLPSSTNSAQVRGTHSFHRIEHGCLPRWSRHSNLPRSNHTMHNRNMPSDAI